jgi:dTDP-4-amino-4,6-dideoxygalactose transaminase
MKEIKLLDLTAQHKKLEPALTNAINEVIQSSDFIKGAAVSKFERNLGAYLDDSIVIGVGNGTDALQLALLALGVEPGDEVIVPSFSYIATAEAVAVCGAIPVLVNVDIRTFTMDVAEIKKAITTKTKVIIPVHLYGQPADMEGIMVLAETHNLHVIEDTAQAIGAEILYKGESKKVGSIGHIGCLSFFPSKNLGAFGDGGAVITNDNSLAEKVRMLANHGQKKRYTHEIIGFNSRLDSIQAAVLNVKLSVLDAYNDRRIEIAKLYSDRLINCEHITLPKIEKNGVHVFHQFTIKVLNKKRDDLKSYLENLGIPVRVYYPKPIHEQESMMNVAVFSDDLGLTKSLNEEVLSLPIHPEMSDDQVEFVADCVLGFL